MSESRVPRMTPPTQIRVGKALQLLSIVLLFALLAGIFAVIGTGHQQEATPIAIPLWMIYSMGVGYLGSDMIRKGRKRQAAAEAVGEATEKRAVEQTPLLCRTGGEHIWLGEDTACFNGCGTTRDDVARHRR